MDESEVSQIVLSSYAIRSIQILYTFKFSILVQHLYLSVGTFVTDMYCQFQRLKVMVS